MPEAILKFNLPEEQEEYHTTMQASNYHCAIWDMMQHFRNRIKYEEMSDAEREVLEKTREKMWEILTEYEVAGDF